MSIFVKADLHGNIVEALGYGRNPDLRQLTADDVLVVCGDDVFDYRNKKHMGMMISLAWKDSVEENVFDFVKKKNLLSISVLSTAL